MSNNPWTCCEVKRDIYQTRVIWEIGQRRNKQEVKSRVALGRDRMHISLRNTVSMQFRHFCSFVLQLLFYLIFNNYQIQTYSISQQICIKGQGVESRLEIE